MRLRIQTKLMLAVALVVALVAGMVISMTEGKVRETYRRLAVERFEAQVDQFLVGRKARLGDLGENLDRLASSNWVRSVFAKGDFSKKALAEFGNKLKPGMGEKGVGGLTKKSARPMSDVIGKRPVPGGLGGNHLVCLVDGQGGLHPLGGAIFRRKMESREALKELSGAGNLAVRQAGYLVSETDDGESRLVEVVVAPVYEQEGGGILGAALMGMMVDFSRNPAARGDHVVPVSTVEFEVDFAASEERTRGEVVEEIRSVLRGIPGTFSAISTPLADRIGHMLSGVSAKIAVKIYGPDLVELRRLGTEVAELARAIPGLEEARTEQQAPIPQLRIEVDRKRALAYGVTPGELNAELAVLMGGEVVAEVYEGQRVYDLVVRLPIEWRENPGRLKNLYIDTQSGQRIPLGYVAEIHQATGPNTILRENTQRRFVVSINPTVDDLNSVVEQLQRDVEEKLELPGGYSISFEGEYQAQQKASRTILVMSAVILVVVIFLLYSYFQNFTFVLLVLSNIPISLIGAILYTRYTLDNISIATLVGFIAITGIAARNNIMMISHYLHLIRHEGEGFTRQMVERGTMERLVPVLMTALAAGIALVPLILAADEPGKEILNPVAIVIVGGLFSSTFLGLGITPAIFYGFCRKAAEKSLRVKAPATE